jgi:hypothetical protein
MTSMQAIAPPLAHVDDKGWLDRALSVFTDVRAGEGVTALLMLLNIFLLAIDTFFVRSGDLLSAAIVFVGTSVLGLSIARFALVNVAIVVVWIGLALVVLNRHRALVQRRDEAA